MKRLLEREKRVRGYGIKKFNHNIDNVAQNTGELKMRLGLDNERNSEDFVESQNVELNDFVEKDTEFETEFAASSFGTPLMRPRSSCNA